MQQASAQSIDTKASRQTMTVIDSTLAGGLTSKTAVENKVGHLIFERYAMTFDSLPILISACSLAISGLVAYLTLFRKGTVKMTQPTTIYFGADAGSRATKSLAPKVYLRTLLYSTAKRGNVISSLHVRLIRGESTQTFNIWVYGEEKLSRGSGLFVGEQGVVLNHHFMPPSDGTSFKFLPGTYTLEVFAAQVDQPNPKLLWSVNLDLSQDLSAQMESDLAGGLHFDWQPNSGSYHAHLR